MRQTGGLGGDLPKILCVFVSIQDILRCSMLHRQHNLMKTIALVLAFTMPFCCCVIDAIAGEPDSCCEKIEVVSCCETVASTQGSPCDQEEEEKSRECCSDCIKGLVLYSNWSVPKALFSSECPKFIHGGVISNAIQLSAVTIKLPPLQRVKITTLGNSSAPSMRGAIILEV